MWTLVGLAALLALVSALTVWSKRQFLDEDAWANTSGRMLADDEVRGTLSTRLVNLLYERVDVAAQLQARLPKEAQGAAPVAAAALQTAAVRAVDAFLATPAAQSLWENANREANARLIDLLEGKDVGPLQTSGGDVAIDLRPMIQRIASRLGVEDRLKARASPNAGQLVVLRSDQLKTAQDALKALKALSVILVLVVFILYGVAIGIATGRRRTVLQVSGATLVLVGLLVLIVRRVAGNLVVDSLVKTEANRPAVDRIWLIGTDLLRDIGIAFVAYGIAVIIAGFLAGPNRFAVRVRRGLAPTFDQRPVLVYGVALVLFLLLIAWGPTASTQRLAGILILGALIALGLEVWRRQMVGELRSGAFEPPQPPVAAPAERGSQLDDLERLARLRTEGVLTEPEFEAQKAALLKT